MIPSCPKKMNPSTDMQSTAELREWCKTMRDLRRCGDWPEVTGRDVEVNKKNLRDWVSAQGRLF